MKIFALIEDDIVANVAMYETLEDAPEGAVDVSNASPRPEGGWSYDGKTFLAPKANVSIAGLSGSLANAVDGICAAVTSSIVPSQTYAQAYLNAATIVWANGGAAPGDAHPAKSQFSALGASVGISDPAAFARVATAVSLGSMQLATILATAKAGIGAAKSKSDLLGVLSDFEFAIGAFVDALSTVGLSVSVSKPAPISIAGLNA